MALADDATSTAAAQGFSVGAQQLLVLFIVFGVA
jgi:hypothetical protein